MKRLALTLLITLSLILAGFIGSPVLADDPPDEDSASVDLEVEVVPPKPSPPGPAPPIPEEEPEEPEEPIEPTEPEEPELVVPEPDEPEVVEPEPVEEEEPEVAEPEVVEPEVEEPEIVVPEIIVPKKPSYLWAYILGGVSAAGGIAALGLWWRRKKRESN